MKPLYASLACSIVVTACGGGGGGDGTDAAPIAAGVLVINEIMPSNTTACADPFGEFDDWIELYNAGDVDLDLGGYYVTDDLRQPTKVILPAGLIVPAHGWKLLWADDQVQGLDHLSFKLDAKGEDFAIAAPDGTQLDMITFGASTTDVSLARFPDGTGAFAACATSTCGAANGPACGAAASR
ncbi:MAG: lamin tail domain-containing protein [Deltaproteobacteria bacterium]|nr:lamin tail domain-containing protein [Deltaproteobacteria bacterium]MCW5808319.1 lamin tail domain-containing protein [Deltaproteobacteria bacterium]